MINTQASKHFDKGSLVRPGRAVIALYIAMLLLAFGIAVYIFTADYNRTRQDIEDRALAYATSMATDVRWYVNVSRQALTRAAERIAANPKSNVGEILYSVISDTMSDLPPGVVVAVYDAEGNSRGISGASSLPVNVSDRPYFRQLREGQDFVISSVIADRVTHTKTFAIGIPLKRDGQFTGAAIAYAPMQVFADAWLNVGRESANAFLVHKGGWITARLPPRDSDIYEDGVPQDFIETFSPGPRGNYWATASPIDGIARVLGYAHVPSTPLIAVIGINPTKPLNALWHRTSIALGVLVTLLAILGYGTWRIQSLIVKQEETEQDLRKALSINEKFLLEIHHRVKNNLQSALSLVRMHVRSPEIMAEIEPRIAAMAKVHEHIYQSDHLVSVSSQSYLTDIAQQIIFASPHKIVLQTDIDPIDLPSDIAMPVGQLLNEAIINAVKYGYPDGREGVILVALKADGEQNATLTVHNNGVPLSASTKPGIGSRLMPAFASQINGSMDTKSDENGVTVTLRFPLNGHLG